jgi:hypothetical protein
MPTDRDSDDTDHHFTQHLDYQDYTTPISFRVTYEGEDTLLPAVEIGRILDHEFDLVRGQTFDSSGGGLGSDEKDWWGSAFDGSAVNNPEEVIEAIQELLDNYNETPEDIPEQGQDEWEQWTVVIKDICGVDEIDNVECSRLRRYSEPSVEGISECGPSVLRWQRGQVTYHNLLLVSHW